MSDCGHRLACSCDNWERAARLATEQAEAYFQLSERRYENYMDEVDARKAADARAKRAEKTLRDVVAYCRMVRVEDLRASHGMTYSLWTEEIARMIEGAS